MTIESDTEDAESVESFLTVAEHTEGIPLGLLPAYHAAREPDRPAITIGDRSVSRAELEARSNRRARALSALGIGQDDFVTVALPNGLEFYETAFAIWKLGATVNPVSWRLPDAELNAIVKTARPTLVVGVDPSRAPGYTVTDELLAVVSEAGALYDSSVFPCPAYFAAKTAKIAAIALLGRTSRSIVDTPSVLRAPTRPYRIGRPYWKRGNGLLELPIQVTRGLRLPFFGTSLTLAAPSMGRSLARGCIGEPLVNLELHGIDVLDEHDGLQALAKHQPDVRVGHEKKMSRLRAAVGELAGAGYTFVTLREAARAFQDAA